MMRKITLTFAIVASLVIARAASAQIVQPKLPQPLPTPKERIDQIEKEIERLLRGVEDVKPIFPMPVPFPKNRAEMEKMERELIERLLRVADVQPDGKTFFGAGLAWGGMRMSSVDKTTQENLGLPEKEGLIVNNVEANSAAEKAGVKVNDILVRIGQTAAPSDFDAFSKVVAKQKADEPLELVVVRNGKEVTLKAARMPAIVQLGVGDPGFGGGGRRLAMPRFDLPPFQINPGIRVVNSTNLINGAKIFRNQGNDVFSGEYDKQQLNIKVRGKFDNGVAKADEIIVQDGKASKTYASVNDVPQQYQPMLRLIMPAVNPYMLPNLRNLQILPGLPGIPGNNK